MKSLKMYADYFDAAYPAYAEARYCEIKDLVSKYASVSALDLDQLSRLAELARPLIAIKNYKSQTPFPEDIVKAIATIIEVKKTSVGKTDKFENHRDLFFTLISLQGFQLPTVSAVLHFCHPEGFPIVDRNVMAACALLKETFPEEFTSFEAPMLPLSNTSAQNKLEKYRNFISFIDHIVLLQRKSHDRISYRDVDKALMVLGVPELRRIAEAKGDCVSSAA